MKTQSALEFMTIIGVGLALLAIISAIGTDYIFSYFNNIDMINARQTVSNIIAASSLVYSQGMGAQTKIAITIPSKMIRNFTYMSGQEVNLRFGHTKNPTDVFKDAGVNISGTIPLLGGKHYLYVRMAPSFFNASKTEIHVYLGNSDYSYIGVQTFNDSASNNPSENFSTTQTIYFNIIVVNQTDYPKEPFVDLKVYAMNGSAVKQDSFKLDLSETYSMNLTVPGNYLISVEVPEVNAVGTHLIQVHA